MPIPGKGNVNCVEFLKEPYWAFRESTELYNKVTNIRQHNKYLLEYSLYTPINICCADVY